MRPVRLLALGLVLFFLTSCREESLDPPVSTLAYELVAVYPHDPSAFTQGLVYGNGVLYEGTGLRGKSSLREVDWKSGRVKRMHQLDQTLFGEGITLSNGLLYQLTWQDGKAFVHSADTFKLLKTFFYSGEGWGLTHDGRHLIMSNGTQVLSFRNPDSFQTVREIAVRLRGKPLKELNELEYLNGSIYANIWKTNHVARIDPATGRVTGLLDLSALEKQAGARAGGAPIDVLNGIAWKADSETLLVTGKLWPLLFEIRLKENPAK